MNITNIQNTSDEFQIHQTTELTQAASMRLKTGDATSDQLEIHPRSEQTVLVLEGELVAEVDQDRRTIRAGDIIIIPPGTKHRFLNESQEDALAFTTYCPPAYRSEV